MDQQDTFGRLVENQTLSSLARRIETKIRREGEKGNRPDSLDLALASTYDHHAVWGAGRANVVQQNILCRNNHAGQWSDYSHGYPANYENSERSGQSRQNFVKDSKPYYHNDRHQIHAEIPPYHTSSSRRGYGRGPQGCFYAT